MRAGGVGNRSKRKRQSAWHTISGVSLANNVGMAIDAPAAPERRLELLARLRASSVIRGWDWRRRQQVAAPVFQLQQLVDQWLGVAS